jgi:hypothetical protein
MKFQTTAKFAVLLGLCAFSSLAHAGSGVRDGGGGSLVLTAEGKLEPADLHYTGHADVIPRTFVPVHFEQYPETVEALQYALLFLKSRSQDHSENGFAQWDLKDEYYFVPELSGQDLLPVESGLTEKQVGMLINPLSKLNFILPVRLFSHARISRISARTFCNREYRADDPEKSPIAED